MQIEKVRARISKFSYKGYMNMDLLAVVTPPSIYQAGYHVMGLKRESLGGSLIL